MMKLILEISSLNMEKSLACLESRMRLVPLPSSALERLELIELMDLNVLKELSKTSMANRLMKNTHGMLNLLSPSKKEKLKNKKKWLDIKTLRRDATCMLKTSHLVPLMSNCKKSSPSLEILKALESSQRKVRLSMPLFASRTLRLLHRLKLTCTNSLSMESLSTLITMKSKKWEKLSMKKCMTRLISRTIKNKEPIFLIFWTNQRYSLSSINLFLYCNLRWWCKTEDNNKEDNTPTNKVDHKMECQNLLDKVCLCPTLCLKWWEHQWTNNNKWEWCHLIWCHQWPHQWLIKLYWVLAISIFQDPCKFCLLLIQTTQITKDKLVR